MLHERYYVEKEKQEEFLNRKNVILQGPPGTRKNLRCKEDGVFYIRKKRHRKNLKELITFMESSPKTD